MQFILVQPDLAVGGGARFSMFVLLARFAWKLVAPLVISVVAGVAVLSVLGFDPVAVLTSWLTDFLHGIEIWATCEVLGGLFGC